MSTPTSRGGPDDPSGPARPGLHLVPAHPDPGVPLNPFGVPSCLTIGRRHQAPPIDQVSGGPRCRMCGCDARDPARCRDRRAGQPCWRTAPGLCSACSRAGALTVAIGGEPAPRAAAARWWTAAGDTVRVIAQLERAEHHLEGVDLLVVALDGPMTTSVRALWRAAYRHGIPSTPWSSTPEDSPLLVVPSNGAGDDPDPLDTHRRAAWTAAAELAAHGLHAQPAIAYATRLDAALGCVPEYPACDRTSHQGASPCER